MISRRETSRARSRRRWADERTSILELVRRAVQAHIPFRAVVADAFYGEDRGFKCGLRDLKGGYMLALKMTIKAEDILTSRVFSEETPEDLGCGSFFCMAGASPATTIDGHEVGTSYSLCVV